MKARILLAEDDPGMRRITKLVLEQAGYKVREAGSAEEALAAILTEGDIPDILLSDIQMPGLSGVKLCELLRGDPRTRQLPIVLLTVLGKLPDRVQGLKTGADDYITKPYEPSELLARLEALLRRVTKTSPTSILEWKDLRVDLERRKTTVDGNPIILRRIEFELLALFLKSEGKVLTRDRIGKLLWPDGTVVSENTLTVHIKHLRDALGLYGNRIETIPREGYRFDNSA